MITKLTAMRLTADDRALLDAIQEHVGTASRTEAFRAALREYARVQGIRWMKRPKGPSTAKGHSNKWSAQMLPPPMPKTVPSGRYVRTPTRKPKRPKTR